MRTNCPCCQQQVSESDLRQTATLFPLMGRPAPGDRNNLAPITKFIEDYNRYPTLYQWACDDCLRESLAILADPRRQLYNFWGVPGAGIPYLAYFDEKRRCENCDRTYVFGKNEQLHWYEELQFIVHSRPKKCPECRKEDRRARNLNTELSELLRDGKPEDPDKLQRIAEIYKIIGKEDKEKAYSRAAAKRRDDR
ncbi:zinc-ribbon domain containing protein [Flavilitoribacter nigricans]|uniref:Probable zinc-binding domain-containing protein n=1 Tax=Flavilitoribacter nigricans (strain ATCC 23147 / DSM 23189 / NBRC 102662 / NCIMB 1420 / SS-2) TaxID=1122177 RepID=A0A2D0N7T3_FLAN2|nr:zinc-ribbon domain containing protein [Flavilitoribacter nigricans]PHN04574.1 hypothetical protein CRP01_21455 [Flavilitoribacter nigricans DSM 23189 = NBRC 102662]